MRSYADCREQAGMIAKAEKEVREKRERENLNKKQKEEVLL